MEIEMTSETPDAVSLREISSINEGMEMNHNIVSLCLLFSKYHHASFQVGGNSFLESTCILYFFVDSPKSFFSKNTIFNLLLLGAAYPVCLGNEGDM